MAFARFNFPVAGIADKLVMILAARGYGRQPGQRSKITGGSFNDDYSRCYRCCVRPAFYSRDDRHSWKKPERVSPLFIVGPAIFIVSGTVMFAGAGHMDKAINIYNR
jgi:hypothetical protein